jgi:hypothetical protein
MTLATVGRQPPVGLGSVTVAEDGSFSVAVTVPPGTSPGETYILFGGSAFDRACDDTKSASCAGYATPALNVTPPT